MALNDNTLALIRKYETGGGSDPAGANVYNYKYNQNPLKYTASGYYQITNSTWREFAPAAGVDTSVYKTAISAPYDVQTNVAREIPINRWTGYNSNLSAALNRGEVIDPASGIGLSPVAGDSLSIDPNLNPGFTDLGDGRYRSNATPLQNDPSNPLGIGSANPAPSTGAGFPGTGGGGINLPGAIGGGIASLVGGAESWLSTILIGGLALILILAGLFWLAFGSPAKAARRAAPLARAAL